MTTVRFLLTNPSADSVTIRPVSYRDAVLLRWLIHGHRFDYNVDTTIPRTLFNDIRCVATELSWNLVY